jgi:hypothetical protein
MEGGEGSGKSVGGGGGGAVELAELESRPEMLMVGSVVMQT